MMEMVLRKPGASMSAGETEEQRAGSTELSFLYLDTKPTYPSASISRKDHHYTT